MTKHSTLLLTSDATVIRQVQSIHDESDSARLEVCGRTDKALSCLTGENQLVLVDSETDSQSITTLLVAAKQLRTPAVVVIPPTVNAPEATTSPPPHLSRLREHPICHLPAGLPALRTLIGNVIATGDLHGQSPAVDPVSAALLGSELEEYVAIIRRVAGQNTTLLLTGETGCGKSMLARLIHEASPRRADPYMVIDCGALSDHLIESEMFGHVRGAFTGADRDRPGKLAAAGTGTLVLDEINSLPLPLQTKLLRAVEDRVFEPVGSNRSEHLQARLIAVSNSLLEEEVRRERFRLDLFYRLNVVELRLPALRERREAIVPLAYQFLRSSAADTKVTAISSSAIAAMTEYSWPGNVRELRNVIERALALTNGPMIQLADLPAHIRDRSPMSPHPLTPPLSPAPPPPAMRPEPHRDDAFAAQYHGDERALLAALLEKHHNNRRRVARELGVSRMTLYKRLHKHGLFVPKCKAAAYSPS